MNERMNEWMNEWVVVNHAYPVKMHPMTSLYILYKWCNPVRSQISESFERNAIIPFIADDLFRYVTLHWSVIWKGLNDGISITLDNETHAYVLEYPTELILNRFKPFLRFYGVTIA